jgi:hypothetical protein
MGDRSMTAAEAERAEAFNGLEPAAPDESAERSRADVLRSKLLDTEGVKKLPPPEPLIDGWLNRNSLAMLYGPSGVGKTHVAIDLAMHVGSTRRWWNANDVVTGQVLYVIAEGASGVGLRTDAWEQHHGDTTADIWWLPEAVSLFDAQWADALAEVVADMRPALVVIDTFARSILGADENSSRDIGVTLASLDRIRRAAGSCVLIVHHSGKNLDAGSRGSSALKAAMDTELELVGDSTRMQLRCTKQKDGPSADPLSLTLRPVSDSVIVAAATASAADDGISKGALETLGSLREIEVPGGIPPSTWLVAVTCAQRTFYRHLQQLLTNKMIENVGTEKRPRYQEVRTDDAQ